MLVDLSHILLGKKQFFWKRKAGGYLFAESSISKRNSHMNEGSHMNICWESQTRIYSLYSCVLSIPLDLPSFLHLCGRFIVTVSFSFCTSNSNILEVRDFHDISTPQHVLKFSMICWKLKWTYDLLVIFLEFL